MLSAIDVKQFPLYRASDLTHSATLCVLGVGTHIFADVEWHIPGPQSPDLDDIWASLELALSEYAKHTEHTLSFPRDIRDALELAALEPKWRIQ